jgi:hypothetical protein
MSLQDSCSEFCLASHSADMRVSLMVANCRVGSRPNPAPPPAHSPDVLKLFDRKVALLTPGRGPVTLVLCNVRVCSDTVNLQQHHTDVFCVEGECCAPAL